MKPDTSSSNQASNPEESPSGNLIDFNKYEADGILLNRKYDLYDEYQKKIGQLEINNISQVHIQEKSTQLYYVGNESDNCQKAFFLKVSYQNKSYVLFGRDVYEINDQQKFSTINAKNEKLTLFPVTNFEMGASDEEGLTGCDDYSILMLFNHKTEQYSLFQYPQNEDIHIKGAYKYANLFHDDGSEEKIYKITMKNDTLVIGIKAIYQEGGSVFNLKVVLNNDFPATFIADRISFETDEELKNMDAYK